MSLKDLYTDGTKIEANANRYTFVWGKAIKTSKERIKQQLMNYGSTPSQWRFPSYDTDPTGFKRSKRASDGHDRDDQQGIEG